MRSHLLIKQLRWGKGKRDRTLGIEGMRSRGSPGICWGRFSRL